MEEQKMSESKLKQVGLSLYDLSRQLKALQDKVKQLKEKSIEIMTSDKAKEIGVFEKPDKKTGKIKLKFKLMDGCYLTESDVDPIFDWSEEKLEMEIVEDFGRSFNIRDVIHLLDSMSYKELDLDAENAEIFLTITKKLSATIQKEYNTNNFYNKFNKDIAIKHVIEKYEGYSEQLETFKKVKRKGYPRISITKS